MIQFFVGRPVTTTMFILFFLILGLVAAMNINVERQPRIDFPLVSVELLYPGADPEEIEGQVIKPIEDALAMVSEIKKMESRTFDNFGTILVEFNLGVDVNDKSAEVKEKVDGIINDLPAGLEKPVVSKVDPFAMPVVWLSLTSDKHSPVELYEFADKKLATEFSRVPGVGRVSILGGQERQIKVVLSVDLMRQKFISIDSVVSQLRMRHIDIPAGDIKRRENTLSVKFKGEFESIEELSELKLNTGDGNQFRLKDIAKVYDGAADPEYGAKFQGDNIVALGIVKIADGNDIEVSRGVNDTLKGVEQLLDDGMRLEVVNDTSTFIVEETRRTLKGIALGVFFTVLVLLFFTGDWRVTLISSLALPFSIFSSLFLVELSQFSINFMTLLAYATALGTLVANAIVVIEGVYKRLESGASPFDAAVLGTKDVIVPVLAAGGTNLVVFAPLSFMEGIVGQFMVQFGLTVIYATLFSLLASFTLTPMLCAVLLKPRQGQKNWLLRSSEAITDGIKQEYRRLFDLMFRFPVLSSLAALMLFFLGVSTASYIGGEFVPVSDEDRIQIVFKYPLGTRIEKTMAEVSQVESFLKELPGVKSTFITAGENGQENAEIVLLLKPSQKRELSDVELIEKMTPFLAKVPDAEIETVRGEPRGGEQPGDISINISAADDSSRLKISEQVINIMRDSGYFRSLTSSQKFPKPQIFFTPRAEAIERYGLTNAQVGQVLRASIYGDDNQIFREGGEQYDIMVETAQDYRDSLDAIDNIFTISPLGLVPLNDLGDVQVRASTPNVLRRDREKVTQINGYLAKSNPGDVMDDLSEQFKSLDWGQGARYQFVGDAEYQEESGRELGKAFLLAVIFTYMILAAILNSFVHPFTISSSIFTSFAGVFLFLFFLESTMNVASMLGMVLLVGLAVNNAILMIEEIQLLRKKDPERPLKEVIWEGIDSRFRAILMTSLAIVFASAPQLWSVDQAKVSMGAVVVGGILGSIVFTFLLMPQTYYFLEKLSTRHKTS